MDETDPEKQDEVKEEAIKRGDIVEATVKRIAPFGAFLKLPDGRKGLVHISQIDDSYVTKIQQHLKVGDSVKAKVVAISEDGKIDLSIKLAKRQLSRKKSKPKQPSKPPKRSSGFRFTPFEEEFKKNLNITSKP